MTIGMNDECIVSVGQVMALIKTAETLGVERVERKDSIDEVYAWMNDLLIRLTYRFLKKKEKGIVRRYLRLYSGYGASHVDHLIQKYARRGVIRRKKRTQPMFSRVYTSTDIALLAEVTEAYQHQNGRALKEVCKEMYTRYRDNRFERLSRISVSRLYDLKKTEIFKTIALTYTKTRPAAVNIGERKKPYPEGRPGFLRVDSVHQGDLDREKGVYHINLVDEVTQGEIVVCVEGISEAFLSPALEEALAQFPFVIQNFHSDNGSEYINKVVARLLEKLLIHQTKSRSRKTNDNALVEGKNGAVIRKHMGFVHIPKRHARAINTFYREYFNPFVNFHRFSAFPDEEVDVRGKIVKKYRTYLTPVQRLLAIENVEQYLKDHITKSGLQTETEKQSHLESAQEMQRAKAQLFKIISAQRML
ncbi:MAG: transposase family protein [Rectinemataceae bacterium]|nr:transposase family protein [Rectinemataceae bacterium]